MVEAPLWTEAHAPAVDDLPQEDVRAYLERAAEEPINLLLQGPPGCGKTAAARALARETHADPEADLIEINVADFFDRTKAEIASDPRFEPFLAGRSSMAKRDMIGHVLKESAGYAPVSGEYKTVLLDNAEAIREDFQQALRRIMERNHRTTQFLLATRQPSKLLPPIRSRCFPLAMRAPTSQEIARILETVLEREGAAYEASGVEFVGGYANGNVRQAILAAQTTVEEAGELTMDAAYETLGSVGLDEPIEALLDSAEAGEFQDARSELDDLLIDRGLDGDEVIDAVLRVARRRYQGATLARVHRLAADVDFGMVEGSTERIQLSRFLAQIGQEATA